MKIIDSTFAHNPTIGLAGENAGELPTYFQWERTRELAPVTVFTDSWLLEVKHSPAQHNIALLLEPEAVSPLPYKAIRQVREHFELILTHSKELLILGEPFVWYPFGGSWIKRWGIFPKTRHTSIIVGYKTSTPGHKLRHEIAQTITGLDRYGQPYTEYMPSKVPMLRPYRYSIIIENCRTDYWFTEKLIDCFSQGTIPIYWGCPSIGRFFNLDGMYTFETVLELQAILGRISEMDYESRMTAIQDNLSRAAQYRCAEDWIYLNVLKGRYDKS